MKERFITQFPHTISNEKRDLSGYKTLIEGLNERLKRVAEAYVDVEMAYMVNAGNKGLNELTKEYCTFGSIILSGSETVLSNESNISHLELYAFMNNLTEEQADILYDRAESLVNEKGYVFVDTMPEVTELKAG